MAKFLKGTFRKPVTFIKRPVAARSMQGLVSSGNVDDELWLLLEYYSEVQDVGLSFLKGRGIISAPQRRKIFKYFQAYVRQAKSFYYAAKALPPRSSSLLYFYCFENLARAALAIYDPTSVNIKKWQHGLKTDAGNRDFRHETVVTYAEGVFPKFYNWYFGAQMKPNSLNVSTLMGYCTDIGYQYQLASIGSRQVLYSYSAVCSSGDQGKTSWALLGIPKAQSILKYPKSFKNFLSSFEEIDVPWQSYERIFEILALERSALTFFQSTQEIPWIENSLNESAVRMQILKAFENSFQINYFGNKFDFAISLPYTQRRQIRMDETVAIYLVMFYLSNLVRYKPQYLEKLLSKKEAWLIDSFVRSCIVTFLRSIVSRTIDTDFVFSNR